MVFIRSLKHWVFHFFRRKKTESLGQRGERVALKYLKNQGYKYLAKNVSNRFGEIDLIVQKQETIVFVEVRTRTDNKHGEPAETISYTKQKKISRAATAYLKSKKWLSRTARFDVVTILWNNLEGEPELKHFINAFELIE